MTKKLVIILSIFCLITLVTSTVFATNIAEDTQNTLNGVKDGVQNMAQDTGNTVEGAKDGVENMMNNAGKGVENMARGVGNIVEDTKDGIENMLHEGENDVQNMGRDVKQDTGESGEAREVKGSSRAEEYTAKRTAAIESANATNRANNITTWVVLATVCAIIIALVWYYATQTNNKDNY